MLILAAVLLLTLIASAAAAAAAAYDHQKFLREDENQALDDLLQKVSGVYQQTPTLADPLAAAELNRTVIITAANHGYLPHLSNFACFMHRMKMKFLTFALDSKLFEETRDIEDMHVLHYNLSGINTSDIEDMSRQHEFRQGFFNEITIRKLRAAYSVLARGYNILFSDTDVAIVNDPISYLLSKKVDYAHSINDVCPMAGPFNISAGHEGNTGFYFVRSNVRTLNMWRQVIETFKHFPEFDDQSIFWNALKSKNVSNFRVYENCTAEYLPTTVSGATDGSAPFTLCGLNSCLFSSGMIRNWNSRSAFVSGLRGTAEGHRSYSVHANFVMKHAKKQENLHDFGLWLFERVAKVNGKKSILCRTLHCDTC